VEQAGRSTPAELLRQAHPPHEILEARFGSNLVELRVRKNPAVNGPFRDRLLVPLQGAVALAEADLFKVVITTWWIDCIS
jgi:hypothetical protein